jgi:hypothetical protein
MEVDVQKRLLGGLTCELHIAQPTHRESHGEALKPYDKRGKRRIVTASCCTDNLFEVASTGYACRLTHTNLDPE